MGTDNSWICGYCLGRAKRAANHQNTRLIFFDGAWSVRGVAVSAKSGSYPWLFIRVAALDFP
jgi:hypothetical protein